MVQYGERLTQKVSKWPDSEDKQRRLAFAQKVTARFPSLTWYILQKPEEVRPMHDHSTGEGCQLTSTTTTTTTTTTINTITNYTKQHQGSPDAPIDICFFLQLCVSGLCRRCEAYRLNYNTLLKAKKRFCACKTRMCVNWFCSCPVREDGSQPEECRCEPCGCDACSSCQVTLSLSKLHHKT